MRRYTLIFLLSLAVTAGHADSTFAADSDRAPAIRARTVQPAYYRTELYLGQSMQGGRSVSDDDWEDFLAVTVTPRFPRGFTVFQARGQ